MLTRVFRSRPFKRFIQRAIRADLISDERLLRTPCSAYGCTNEVSTEQWMQGVCADVHTRGQMSPVCTECDIKLNEHHLRFFFGPARDADLADYAAYKRGQPAPPPFDRGGR